jgi:hypothetical protein
MKVVIGKHGHFFISREAWLWLLEHGFDPMEEFPSAYFPTEFASDNSFFMEDSMQKFYEEEKKDHFKYLTKYNKANYTDRYDSFDKYVNSGYNYDIEIPRNHPLLIQMVEELGILVNPIRDFSDPPVREDNLYIVEIPDNIKFRINQHSGSGEFIEEEHGAWR